MELVVAGEGGDDAESELHGHEGEPSRLQPDPGLLDVAPVGGEQGQDPLGTTLGHAATDRQGHQQAVAGRDEEHRDLKSSKGSS